MSARKSWKEPLPFGLPDDFNFSVIRSRADVVSLMAALPNADRGVLARKLYERRDHIGNALVFFALMDVWDHDYREVVNAFGETPDAFTAAVREVAPPIKRRRPVRLWRGIRVLKAHPGDAAIGLSWTRGREIACWFATTYRSYGDPPGVRPFVFTVQLMPSDILAFHDGRKEREALVDLSVLEFGGVEITVDGTPIRLNDLESDSVPPAAALADWCVAAGHMRHEKD